MKVKSLALLLSAGLFAATASATSVVLYGNLDAAVVGTKTTVKTEVTNTASFSEQESGKALPLSVAGITVPAPTTTNNGNKKAYLANGFFKGSFLGFKGVANITENSVAGFVLEAGYNVVNGNIPSTQLFSRGATVYVQGLFGRLAFGYQPDMASAYGMNNVYAHTVDAFVNMDAGASSVVNGRMIYNALSYKTPTIAGLDVSLLFSPDALAQGNEFKKNTHFYQAALHFAAGPVELVAMGSYTEYPGGTYIQGNKDGNVIEEYIYEQANPVPNSSNLPQYPLLIAKKNSIIARLGGNITLGPVKLFASGQKTWKAEKNMDGWGANVGAALQLGKSALLADVSYSKSKYNNSLDPKYLNDPSNPASGYQDAVKSMDFKMDLMGVRLVYAYQVSKTANLYIGGTYNQSKYTVKETTDVKNIAAVGTTTKYQISSSTNRVQTVKDMAGFVGMSVSF